MELSPASKPLTDLPPRRDAAGGVYSVALICLGNICRSAMAHIVLVRKLAEAGLSSRVVVDSAGTGDWHLGQPMDPRAAAALATGGYDPSRHRARHFEGGWFAPHDLILVMDDDNRDDVLHLAPGPADRDRVRMFREYDPRAHGDLVLPDPWYGGEASFRNVLAIVERTADNLVHLLERLPLDDS